MDAIRELVLSVWGMINVGGFAVGSVIMLGLYILCFTLGLWLFIKDFFPW